MPPFYITAPVLYFKSTAQKPDPVESTESCDSETSIEPEKDVVVAKDGNLEDGQTFEWF